MRNLHIKLAACSRTGIAAAIDPYVCLKMGKASGFTSGNYDGGDVVQSILMFLFPVQSIVTIQ